MFRTIVYFIFSCILFTSCASHLIKRDGATTKYKNVEQYFKKSKVLQDHLTGLVLYDHKKKEHVFNQNGGKFFTPASNTKMWTLYAALNVLGDSIPWMAYDDTNDKRVFYPMGDASYLHPLLDENPRIANYFANHFQAGDTVYLNTDHYQDFRFGAGWMWDDRSDYYQAEKSVFPIYSNCVKLIPGPAAVSYEPEWMTLFAGYSDHPSRYREEYQNVFIIPREQKKSVYMPMVIDRDHYRSYFKSLNLHLEFVDQPFNSARVKYIHSLSSYELYKFYMETSDNLIAEQLLLQCSMAKLGYMNTKAIIDTIMKQECAWAQNGWNWYDGSGLSRYNLVTPETMVELVNRLVEKLGLDELEEILPAAGEEGTLENWYKYDQPRIFAKTGTLKYCHNLSGLVHTKKGNVYSFSFMHNNFNYASSGVKGAMSDVLDIVVELY